jgi:hypothetical protein
MGPAPRSSNRARSSCWQQLSSMESRNQTCVRSLRAHCESGEGGWATELFGDYSPTTGVIRIWTRTAVRKQVTSFETFLSTLCHEFCHHLDCQRFGFRQSPHTRGFYGRAGALYHHARGTPMKPLAWVRVPGNRWRIDWRRMRAASDKQGPLDIGKNKGQAVEAAQVVLMQID